MVAEVVLLGQARTFKVIKIIYEMICVGAIDWHNSCCLNERNAHDNDESAYI